MGILLCAATAFEIAPTLEWLEKEFPGKENSFFVRGELRVLPLISGVGVPATMFSLASLFANWKPKLAINAGVAGSFSPEIGIGKVVNVVSEKFADLGMEGRDGSLTDLFELGFVDKNSTPYINGVLHNPDAANSSFLPKAKGLTVNKVSGSVPTILQLAKKYPDAEVESMEGAAFFYACLMAGVPFLQIRSISNFVEPRDFGKWELEGSIRNLNEVLISMISEVGH